MDIFDITASALSANRLRLDTIAGNLANVNTTRNTEGLPEAYRRKNVIFAPLLEEAQNAGQSGGGSFGIGPSGRPTINAGTSYFSQPSAQVGVQVLEISSDTETPTRKVYEPDHPDADADGFVEYPNINTVTEMVDMIAASRAYEASITAFQTSKTMSEATLQM